MVEDCSRHGVARHVEVVAGRDETVVEPPGLQLRGDAPGIGVRRGERQGDVLPLLSGVLENIGLVGDLHRLRQPARTDVVRGEPAGVADVVGQRERRLAGRGGFDPHLHFAHRVRLSAAQIHQFGQNLPSALVDFLFFRVEGERLAFQRFQPCGIVLVQLPDGGQRGGDVPVGDRAVRFQQFALRIHDLARGLQPVQLPLRLFERLFERLLAGRAFEAVGVVEKPVDGRHREWAFGADLHALVIQIGRQAGEYDRRISGREVYLPGARHLRPVDEQGHFFNGGLDFLRSGDGRNSCGQRQQQQHAFQIHCFVGLGWLQTKLVNYSERPNIRACCPHRACISPPRLLPVRACFSPPRLLSARAAPTRTPASRAPSCGGSGPCRGCRCCLRGCGAPRVWACIRPFGRPCPPACRLRGRACPPAPSG